VLVIVSNVPGRSAPFAVFLLVLSSGAARAADADRAAEAYERALKLYAAGDVAGALGSMAESYRLSKRPELLYNLARLEDEAGDCAAALADYGAYLERVPRGKYRTQAEQQSQELGKRCPTTQEAEAAPARTVPANDVSQTSSAAVVGTTTEASPPEPQSPSPAAPVADGPQLTSHPTPSNAQRWLGWSAIAAGGLAGAGAVYFAVAALDARSRFRSSLELEAAGGPYADFGLQREQHREEHWAQALAVTSGAFLGGGVLLLVLGRRAATTATVTAGVMVTPTHVAGQFSASF